MALSDLDSVGGSASVEIAVRRRVFQERLNLHREVEVQPAGWQKQHHRMRRPNRIQNHLQTAGYGFHCKFLEQLG